MTIPRYLRAPEIVPALNMSLRTVRRWIASGELKSTKVGGARLVSEDDLLAFLGRGQGDLKGTEHHEENQ